MKKPIVAIDGPAGSGKSTVAKIVAKRLGFIYIDSGAMYRTLALKAVKNGISLDDKEKIVKMAEGAVIELKNDGEKNKVILDGNDVSGAIRTEEISAKTKIVAAIGEVRAIIRAKQQAMGSAGGVVMEGRDIGTRVFPAAEYKFYLDASIECRAERRYNEQKSKGETVSLDEIKRQIIERDEKDKTRHESPLVAAKDAEVVDTTKLSIEEVAGLIVKKIEDEEGGGKDKVKIHWLFYLGRFFFRVVFKIFWRLEIVGRENIPKSGGLLIAPNHLTYADPPLTGAAVNRPVHFMAKKELFDMPVLGFLIKRTNAFPIKRGMQDIGAFRKVFKLIESGEALMVFPEGTRSKDGGFGKARAGLGMIACISQVPVVPARIVNSDKLMSFKKLKYIFGKPMMPPKEYTKEDYLKFSEQVLEEIKKL